MDTLSLILLCVTFGCATLEIVGEQLAMAERGEVFPRGRCAPRPVVKRSWP